eukprot:1944611-Rhodomonas_salina.1
MSHHVLPQVKRRASISLLFELSRSWKQETGMRGKGSEKSQKRRDGAREKRERIASKQGARGADPCGLALVDAVVADGRVRAI